MSNWKIYKLGNLATLNYGKSLVADKRIEGEIPVYSSSGISGWHNEPLVNSEAIIVGRKGNVGSVFYSNQPFYCIDTAYYILPDKNYDLKFLYYKLLSMNLIRLTSDSAVPGLNRETVYAQEIRIPSNLNEQIQIAQILSSLDDKIELLQQMNQTLENIAQAIFKEWFVDFNFPGFDGELVDGLPRGWRMGNILEIATLLSGGTPKTNVPEYWNGDINWISAKDITISNNQFIVETEKTITELGIKKSAAKLLPIFTTIISARGTVGNFCILSKEMTISQSNYGLKSNSNDDFFLFLMVKNMIKMMKAFSYGTVFDTITTKTFQEMEIIIPENTSIVEFEKIIKPIYDKILTNQLQTQTLTHTRDTLLPKLMSGQIEIKE